MPNLYVPGTVADSILRDKARGRSEAQRVLEFYKRLKALDTRFKDVFLAAEDNPLLNLRKGFWYLERRDEQGVAFFEVSNPDGSYKEPDDQVLEALRQSDTWSRDVWRDIERGRREREARLATDRQKRQEEMAEDLKDRADFEFRVQVPVTPDGRGRLRSR